MYKSIFTLLMFLAFGSLTFAQNEMRTNVSTFDVVPLKTSSHYNGNDQKGGFWNGHFFYRNSYDTVWKLWSGIAVSNNTDTITNSFTNEYSSITGGGINGTKNYAVCFMGGTIIPESSQKLTGFYVTNTTYTYRTIKEGSAFSKKFGGATGNDKDWYRLKIMSYSGGVRSDSTLFYLADFRDDNNAKDYIIRDWAWVDLENFKNCDSLVLSFESSDVGQFGINTPMYVAIDDVNTQPRLGPSDEIRSFDNLELLTTDSIWDGHQDTSGGFLYNGLYFENSYNTQWNVWNGWALSRQKDTSKSGTAAQTIAIAPGTGGYSVAYGRTSIRLPYGWKGKGFNLNFRISNSTYSFKDMKYGSSFSKKFGGISGNDPDYLKLNMVYFNKKNEPTDTISFWLADYSANPKLLLSYWAPLVNGFGNDVQRLEFYLESSDNGQFGMNTPAYFCLDNMFLKPVSIEKIGNHKIKIYPNPSCNFITIDVQNADAIEITDLSGRSFISIKNPESNQIGISFLPQGVYCLKVRSKNNIYTARFVKL